SRECRSVGDLGRACFADRAGARPDRHGVGPASARAISRRYLSRLLPRRSDRARRAFAAARGPLIAGVPLPDAAGRPLATGREPAKPPWVLIVSVPDPRGETSKDNQ